jgi:hypothetical protein
MDQLFWSTVTGQRENVVCSLLFCFAKTPKPIRHAKTNQKFPVLLAGGRQFRHLADHAYRRSIRTSGNHGNQWSRRTAVQHTFAQRFLFRDILNT